MDVVIVAQYLGNFYSETKTNSRFIVLGSMLKQEGHDIEIITTQFIHLQKKLVNNIPKEYGGCKISAFYEPGYKKNICLSRLYSHNVLAKNISKYLESRKKPDVIYCAVPSLDVALIVSKYAKKNNVRFIVDIQDLWPEAFKMVLKIPVISDIIFAPLSVKANKIYKSADHIVAVSETYIKRAKKANKNANTTVAFLGAVLSEFDSYANAEKNCEKIRLGYVGTLGRSYDIPSVLNAMRKLSKEQLNNFEFIIMGDGPLMKEFEKDAYQLPVKFTGRLSYEKMVENLSNCDMAINPIRKGSAGSIINKVGDYAMAGLPVINTQECLEYRNLIDIYNAGINCECENEDQIAKAISQLIESKELRNEMGKGNRKLAEEKFDRAITYKEIVMVINSLQK